MLNIFNSQQLRRNLTEKISGNDTVGDIFPFSTPWKALQIFSTYRVFLAIALMVAYLINPENRFLGNENPSLFYIASLSFLFLSLIGFFLSFLFKRFYYAQLQLQILIDISLIVLMMHASGGSSSGLGVLIAISTSTACILTGSPAALAFSVLASFGMLAEELYSQMTNSHNKTGMTQVGILSVMFMATSLLSYNLSRRIIETESVAKASMKGLANMEKLNEEIIQFMSTGVLVVDGNNQIRLINRSAWIHLGMPQSTKSHKLSEISTPLARQLDLWRRKSSFHSKPFRNTATGPSLSPNFSPIDESKENTIIFLEDTTVLNQQAQSLKLASLGRLTASIAHEIRNPLGALSHAAQLMKESEHTDPTNLSLIDIIEKNTHRVNNIIENIMNLSQRKTVQAKSVNLANFLPTMINEFTSTQDEPPIFDLHIQSSNITVHFDLSQLSQILTNLIDNAARYSEIKTGIKHVKIMCGVEAHSHSIFLDVIDQGDGISPEISEKLFEPFFTTSRSGTGLGLYLSKELCEANHARLDYIPIATGGSCFRISFSPANLKNKNESLAS